MFNKKELELMLESVIIHRMREIEHICSDTSDNKEIRKERQTKLDELLALATKIQVKMEDIVVSKGVEDIMNDFMSGRSNNLDGIDGLSKINLNIKPLDLK